MIRSDSSGPLQLDFAESVPFVTLLTLIGTAAIGTNFLIVDVMCKYAQHRKIYKVFMLHSSLVDLLTVIIIIWIFSAIHGDFHFGNDAFCEICATASFMALVAPNYFPYTYRSKQALRSRRQETFSADFQGLQGKNNGCTCVDCIRCGQQHSPLHLAWCSGLSVPAGFDDQRLVYHGSSGVLRRFTSQCQLLCARL